MKSFKRILSYKVFWAGVAGSIAYLLKQPHIGPSEIADAITIISAAGSSRDLIDKFLPPELSKH